MIYEETELGFDSNEERTKSQNYQGKQTLRATCSQTNVQMFFTGADSGTIQKGGLGEGFYH
jgi:hypothetical protein